jgi:transposase-like protein
MGEQRRNYTDECKREAIRLVAEHGYGVSETARNLGSPAALVPRQR